MDKEALTRQAQDFLQELLTHSGLDLDFRYEVEDPVISVHLHGEDADMVLGNNARLLYAISHLLNRAFYYRSDGAYNFVVDCNEYLAARMMELQLLASKAAEEVKRSGAPHELQAMPASERRTVHMALVEEQGIRTESAGTGMHRRVVVLPEN